MNGKSDQRSLLKEFQISRAGIFSEYFLLFFFGMFAIYVHARFRYNLGIPGHHGLEYMSLIMMARTASRIKWASVIMSLGILALLFVPFIGLKNPVTAIVFVLPPIIVDIFYNLTKTWRNKILLLAIAGGIAYAFLPISKTIIHFTAGIPYKALLKNPVLPFITHFIFGFAGSILGAGLVYSIKNFRKTNNEN